MKYDSSVGFEIGLEIMFLWRFSWSNLELLKLELYTLPIVQSFWNFTYFIEIAHSSIYKKQLSELHGKYYSVSWKID